MLDRPSALRQPKPSNLPMAELCHVPHAKRSLEIRHPGSSGPQSPAAFTKRRPLRALGVCHQLSAGISQALCVQASTRSSTEHRARPTEAILKSRCPGGSPGTTALQARPREACPRSTFTKTCPESPCLSLEALTQTASHTKPTPTWQRVTSTSESLQGPKTRIH